MSAPSMAVRRTVLRDSFTNLPSKQKSSSFYCAILLLTCMLTRYSEDFISEVIIWIKNCYTVKMNHAFFHSQQYGGAENRWSLIYCSHQTVPWYSHASDLFKVSFHKMLLEAIKIKQCTENAYLFSKICLI